MTGLQKVVRGCAITAGVLAAVLVLLGAWVFHSLRSLEPGPQPDAAKAARSASAQAADHAVSTQVDSRIAQMRAALPWATYLGTAVSDSCGAQLKPVAAIGAKESWLPVTCTRIDTVYEAFDGDFRQHLVQLDGALAAADWQVGDRTLVPREPPGAQETPGLAALLDYMHQPPQDPTPAQIAASAREPNIARMNYVVPITRDFPPAAGAHPAPLTNATVEVTQAPHLPSLDGGQSTHDISVRYPSSGTYYQAWQPYSPAQVAAAYPAHSAVIAIALTVSYGVGPAGG